MIRITFTVKQLVALIEYIASLEDVVETDWGRSDAKPPGTILNIYPASYDRADAQQAISILRAC